MRARSRTARRGPAIAAGLGLLGLLLLPPGPPGALRAQPDETQRLEALGYVDRRAEADPERRGVTRHVPEWSSPGYDLYTDDEDEVFLQDLSGHRLHSWRLPGKKDCQHAELLEDGGLAVVCAGEALALLDWDSSLRWQLDAPVHHDVAVLPDGGFLVPVRPEPRRYRGRRVTFDEVVELSAEGEIVRRWSTWEAFPELRRRHEATGLDTPPSLRSRLEGLLGWLRDGEAPTFDYYHLNSVEVLPETPLGRRDPRFRAGGVLLSLRNADLVLVLDWSDFSVEWHWGPGVLDKQHMPSLTPSGHVLVFDNGFGRGHSRVLELDPATERIVWRYPEEARESFFSRWQGSAQRLPNGNTLVCESDEGHVLELTPEGRVAWEFWNPDIADGKRRAIYRFTRLPTELVRSIRPSLPPPRPPR